MRTIVSLCSTFFLITLPAFAAPAPNDKPKWEYAELTVRNNPRLAPKDGDDVPATPPPPTIRWITNSGEIEAKGFADMAEMLKAPAIKKDASAALQRIQFLNYLGSEGWEILPLGGSTPPGGFGTTAPGGRGTTTSAGTWMFKRRVQ